MELSITIPQEVIHNFLERHSKWDGDEDTTPHLYLGDPKGEGGYEAEAYPLADDAILVGITLQNFLNAMAELNDDPYEVWFALIKNSEDIWEQGKHKVLIFEESMDLHEAEGYSALLENLRAS